MKITHYSVQGFRNLGFCELFPDGLHVITGCNGVGKSNLLQSLTFLSYFHSASETQRELLMRGSDSNGTWIPFRGRNNPQQPTFMLGGEIVVDGIIWEFSYALVFSQPLINEGNYSLLASPLEVHEEWLKTKAKGSPGMQRIVFKRDSKGVVTVSPEDSKRSRQRLEVFANSSALYALRVIHANNFKSKFPVSSAFLEGLSQIKTIRLSPTLLLEFNNHYPWSGDKIAKLTEENINSVKAINLFDYIGRIKENELAFEKLKFWLQHLLRIDSTYHNVKTTETGLEQTTEVRQILIFHQDGRFILPSELSSGSIVLIALISILLDPEFGDKIISIEEPEAYLHPKAIVDLITLVKEVAFKNTILMSTHSPVILNSLDVNNVTLLSFEEHNLGRTTPVKDISEAVKTIERGYVTLGDLLQNNFDLENEEA